MIVHAFYRRGFEKEGGASRETPNRDYYCCHHILFGACRSGLEPVVIR